MTRAFTKIGIVAATTALAGMTVAAGVAHADGAIDDDLLPAPSLTITNATGGKTISAGQQMLVTVGACPGNTPSSPELISGIGTERIIRVTTNDADRSQTLANFRGWRFEDTTGSFSNNIEFMGTAHNTLEANRTKAYQFNVTIPEAKELPKEILSTGKLLVTADCTNSNDAIKHHTASQVVTLEGLDAQPNPDPTKPSAPATDKTDPSSVSTENSTPSTPPNPDPTNTSKTQDPNFIKTTVPATKQTFTPPKPDAEVDPTQAKPAQSKEKDKGTDQGKAKGVSAKQVPDQKQQTKGQQATEQKTTGKAQTATTSGPTLAHTGFEQVLIPAAALVALAGTGLIVAHRKH